MTVSICRAPQRDFLLEANATLCHAPTIDVPSFEDKSRIGQHAGGFDLVNRDIEIERSGRNRRIEAPCDGDDGFPPSLQA